MAGRKGAATAEDQSQDTQEQQQSSIDVDELANKVGEKIASEFNLDNLKAFLKELLTEMGYSDKEITPDLMHKAFLAMPAEKRDPTLRELGLVPTPGFFSSLLGWHNIEHMRSRGWQNKVAGTMGLLYQGAAIGLAIYLGVDWYRSSAA